MNNTEILNYIKKSFELKNQGFYKPAIEMLYKALAIDSENLEILLQLAHLYKLLDNFERAVYYVEKVLDINPNHIESLFLLEDIYLAQNNLAEAKGVVSKIYEIQPTNKNLSKKISVLNKLNDFSAIKEIEASAVEIDDDVLCEIARAYYNNNQSAKALELLELGFAKNNNNPQIMLLLGKIYYENQESDKAFSMFEKLSSIEPSGEVMNYLGLLKLNEKKLVEAIDYFSKAKESQAQKAEYLYNLASAYFLNGWLDEALKYFNQSISLDPQNIRYHYSVAYLYYQKKDYDKALIELDFISKIDSNHSLSIVLDSMIKAKRGDLLGAKNSLEDAIKSDNDDFAYYALSQVYKELSQIELAKVTINRALDLNPQSLEYMSELAEIEFIQNQHESAVKLVNKILDINQKYIAAHILLAKIYMAENDYNSLFDTAQDIIELDSNSYEGYYYNAVALFEQGDRDFALESLKKAISLDLTNALLYAKMSEFYQELGDFKNAYIWAKEASDVDERNYKYKWLCAKLAATLKNEEDAVKYYSLSYRIASFDKDLAEDYSKYLKSIGKSKQAENILNSQFIN